MPNLLPLVTFLQHQPWVALLPLVVLAFSDGILGYLAGRTRGEKFRFQRFADFMETSVGAHQLAWVVGSVVIVYLASGQGPAVAALLTLGATSGVAYAKIAADVFNKVQHLVAPTVV